MTVELKIYGIDEAIAYLEDIKVSKRLGVAIEKTVSALARLAASITPVVTGAMRAAWCGTSSGLEGRVYIDPAAVNPRSGVPVVNYAGVVSERRGIMDALISESDRLASAALEEEFDVY